MINRFSMMRAKNAFAGDFYDMLQKNCGNCDMELIANEIVGVDGAEIFCLLCVMREAQFTHEVALFSKFLKVSIGCEICGYSRHAFALQYDHKNPAEKYRTKSGKIIHPSDLFRTCSALVFVAEVMKCVIRCANCHAEKTAKERGL